MRTHTQFRLRGFYQLEDRATPAITFRFDYRFDDFGFFNDPSRRAILEQAAAEVGNRIDSPLAAIRPAGGNSWQAQVFTPATNSWTSVPQLNVANNEMVIFVGGTDAPGDEAAFANTGGWNGRGSNAWLNSIATRNHTGYSNWGGSIYFDVHQQWNFKTDPLTANQADFYTTLQHELGHILGLGTSSQFSSLTSDGYFHGTEAIRVYGSPPLMDSSDSHWAQGTTLSGVQALLQPDLVPGERYGLSELDYAALKDIGWAVSQAPVTPLTKITLPILHGAEYLVVGGGPQGTVQISQLVGTQITNVGSPIRPFADFGGTVRGVSADFNGDGTADFAFATGPGGGSRIRVIDGRTFADVTGVTSAFETSFNGGVFLATADVNSDGTDELIVCPDNGGSGRVSVFTLQNQSWKTLANFFAIEDTNFRGGARIATGDVNGDGHPDLIVGAGYGGGPRVALFDGQYLNGAWSIPPKLRGDFFAFPDDASLALRNGVFLSAGDLTGDGKADLVFGTGPGGNSRVIGYTAEEILNTSPRNRLAEWDFLASSDNATSGVRVTVKNGLILSSPAENALGTISIFNSQESLLNNHSLWGSVYNGVDVG